MSPSTSDIVEVNQVLSLFGHLLDKRAWDRFSEVFTDDALYDCSDRLRRTPSGWRLASRVLALQGEPR